MSTTPETIHWHDAGIKLPSVVLSVLCRSTDHSVCECYCAGRNDDGLPIWRTITGWPILDVTHWAERPKGPATSAFDNLQASDLEHHGFTTSGAIGMP